MSDIRFAGLEHRGRNLDIEYQWVGAQDWHAPVVVFLHEGLGSLAMWRDFPDAFCRAGNFRGLVYSRPGYGRSTPRPHEEKWPVEFMHIQAREILPAFLDALAVTEPVWLFGHSDGASIALMFASWFAARAKGIVALAPHLFVEDICIKSIEDARVAYRTTDLKSRLARYHDDVDSAFWGWNDIWLNPDFRRWNIEEHMAGVRAPVLAVQGFEDQYGTMAQIDTLRRLASNVALLKLENCRHSAHRDQPEILSASALAFMRESG